MTTRSAIIQPQISLIDSFTEASGTVNLENHTPEYPKTGVWSSLGLTASVAQIVAANDVVTKSATASIFYNIDLGARPSQVICSFKTISTSKSAAVVPVVIRSDALGNGLAVRISSLSANLIVGLYPIVEGVLGTVIAEQLGTGGNNLATAQDIIVTDTGTTVTVDATAASAGCLITAQPTTLYASNTGVGIASYSSEINDTWDSIIAYA